MNFLRNFFKSENFGAWEPFIDSIQDSQLKRKWRQVVKDFYILDKLSLEKVKGNSQVMQYSDRRLAVSFIRLEGKEDFTSFATASIDRLAGIGNKPSGYDDWFVFGYPDVAQWMMGIEDDSDLLRIAGIDGATDDKEEYGRLYNEQKLIRPEILRRFVDEFKKQHSLECSR